MAASKKLRCETETENAPPGCVLGVITNMNVFLKEDNVIVYEHYEKPMSCKKVMHADSAISLSYKRSVNTQEVLRRLFNSSRRLEWKTEVAPKISVYL
jgi:hypothetical protein